MYLFDMYDYFVCDGVWVFYCVVVECFGLVFIFVECDDDIFLFGEVIVEVCWVVEIEVEVLVVVLWVVYGC